MYNAKHPLKKCPSRDFQAFIVGAKILQNISHTNYMYSFEQEVDSTGWPKSQYTEKKLNISLTVRANNLIFLSMIEVWPKFIFIKKCLDGLLY